MSNDDKTLNQQNASVISIYIVINTLMFLVLKLRIPLNDATGTIVEKLLASATWVLIIGLLTTIINGPLSSQIKAVLVFWRITETLPGCRAFSYFIEKDPRIDPKTLQAKFGNLPTAPIEQNRLWYKIYKQHQDKKPIEDAHKKFLLTRDLTSVSLLFFIFFGFSGYFLLDSFKVWIIYTFILFVLFLTISQAARNYGAQLVSNVLAEETSA